jgi:hypothetical protein
MGEQDIIGALVKGRERFRHLVRLYLRQREEAAAARPTTAILSEIDQCLAAAMGLFRDLPGKPGDACATDEGRNYAGKLLREIADLLEVVMVLDREMRTVSAALQQASRPGASRDQALRAYART